MKLLQSIIIFLSSGTTKQIWKQAQKLNIQNY